MSIGVIRGIGAPRGCWGLLGALGVSGVHWGTGREYRFSGARRGYKWHQGAFGLRGVGAVRGCHGVYWWLAGSVGTQGPVGV